MVGKHNNTPGSLCLSALLAAAICLGVGCTSEPKYPKPDASFSELGSPTPAFGPRTEEERRAEAENRVYVAIVQRIDLPLDQPLDEVWQTIDEEGFPAITRGVWRANGMRLGLLTEDRLEAFSQRMPELVDMFESKVMVGARAMPIMYTPRLPGDLSFPLDLTRPPAPPNVVRIEGGHSGRFQLLASLEKDEQGRTFITLTPHHYLPKPNLLEPRDIIESQLDGRVYDELAIRVEVTDDRLLVVGLHWPWPLVEQDVETTQSTPEQPRPGQYEWQVAQTDAGGDPAAPPSHLRSRQAEEPDEADTPSPPRQDDAEQAEPSGARFVRVAPALPMHLGRVLLTGRRDNKRVQSLLLISIPAQVTAPEQPPEQTLEQAPEQAIEGEADRVEMVPSVDDETD